MLSILYTLFHSVTKKPYEGDTLIFHNVGCRRQSWALTILGQREGMGGILLGVWSLKSSVEERKSEKREAQVEERAQVKALGGESEACRN